MGPFVILDLFFTVAVPFVVICVVVAKIAVPLLEKKGVYQSPEGEARRDEINEKHRTNLGAAVIAGVFVILWVLTLLALIEEWGAIFFTFVIGALMIIPFMAVCSCAIMVYMFSVHGIANMKSRSSTPSNR